MSRNDSLRRLFDVLDYLVDHRVGIVKMVGEAPLEPGAPDFFHCYAQACNTGAFVLQENFASCGAASTDRQVARARAIGEAIERYCAAIYDPDELPLTSYREARFPCVPPNEWALYSPEQYQEEAFQFVPFNGDTPVRWTPSVDLLTQQTIYAPAAMVYIPYFFYLSTGELPIAQPISTGLACHCSLAEATVSAICEVIERDAFMITWQARLAPAHIRIETVPEETREMVRRFELAGYTIDLLDVTTDVRVPTVLATCRNSSPQAPGFVVSAATARTPLAAARKSLEELEHTRAWCRTILVNQPRLDPGEGYKNVVDQTTHLNFWCDQKHLPLADFLFTSERYVDLDDVGDSGAKDCRDDLEYLTARVRTLGHRLLVSEVTTSDVRELGLRVVRAIIPGFHPFFVGHRYRVLGGRRLWEVPRRLGFSGIIKKGRDNPVPHPYP